MSKRRVENVLSAIILHGSNVNFNVILKEGAKERDKSELHKSRCNLFALLHQRMQWESKQVLLLELHKRWTPDRDNYYLNTYCLYYTSHSET